MIKKLIEDKFLGKEVEIYLNGHSYYNPGNPSIYDGKRESTEWSLEPFETKTIHREDGSWSRFRTIKKKVVTVVSVTAMPDYEGTTWHLTCQGKKGKEYSLRVPE